MVTDPYSVLGITKDATEQEIKKAYRQKAKLYHPDFHPDDPEAARKMNEVNEAYDMLTNPDKYASRRAQQQQQQSRQQYQSSENRYSSTYSSDSGGWSSDFGYGFYDFFGFGGGSTRHDTRPRAESPDSAEIRSAIDLIDRGHFQEAIAVLATVVSTLRNGRWYYIASVAYHGSGNNARAMDLLTRAIRLEPENRMYLQLMQEYRYSARTYSTQQSRSYSTTGFNPFRMLIRFIGIFLFIQIALGWIITCGSSGGSSQSGTSSSQQYYYYMTPGGYTWVRQ